MTSISIATSNLCTDATTRKLARSRMARVRLATATLTVLAIANAHAGTSGNITLASDYVFRGVSQTNQKPALQAGIEYAADSGFYAGSWGSNISWLSDLSTTLAPISSSLELDLYGGYRGKFSDAVSYDVGALYYWYPGDFPSGFNSADTLEVYAGLTVAASEKVSLGAKYFHAATDLFGYADSDGSGYLDLTANVALDDGWAIGAHAGKQWIDGNDAFEYTDWKLGVTKSFESGFSVGLAYSDTDADTALYTNAFGNRIAGSALVLSVAKSF
ncbi:MAG: TorF family putative porin [Pseudomonadota bacterium]|nr:TorF family putative porin [Pseudomonadota bacterium]